MAEYDGVYVFRPADGEGVPCHFDDGDGKMYQNAYCQQDFDAQHDAEGAVEWVVQYSAGSGCTPSTMPLMNRVMTTGGITRTAR